MHTHKQVLLKTQSSPLDCCTDIVLPSSTFILFTSGSVSHVSS